MVPAPKSVSVLWALEKRKRTIRAISDAHMEAVSAAAIELQRSAGSVRIGPAYFDTVLNIYRLEHYSNDRNDPFLHTHLIVDTEVHDGSRHGSLDVPALQDAVEVVGAHYQLSLERELWSRLKVAFEERRGRRDRQLCGIDNELTNVFADGSCQLGFRQFMATP
jgi:hypothetical protein